MGEDDGRNGLATSGRVINEIKEHVYGTPIYRCACNISWRFYLTHRTLTSSAAHWTRRQIRRHLFSSEGRRGRKRERERRTDERTIFLLVTSFRSALHPPSQVDGASPFSCSCMQTKLPNHSRNFPERNVDASVDKWDNNSIPAGYHFFSRCRSIRLRDMCIHAYAQICTYTYICIYTYTYVHIYVYMH